MSSYVSLTFCGNIKPTSLCRLHRIICNPSIHRNRPIFLLNYFFYYGKSPINCGIHKKIFLYHTFAKKYTFHYSHWIQSKQVPRYQKASGTNAIDWQDCPNIDKNRKKLTKLPKFQSKTLRLRKSDTDNIHSKQAIQTSNTKRHVKLLT